LGAREVALIGPAFVAVSVGLAEIGYVAVLLVFAVWISNYLRAIEGTTLLRRIGVSTRSVYLYWIAISVCLVGVSIAGFSLVKGAGSGVRAFTLAAGGGAMLASLPAFEPRDEVDRGGLGFVASLRFGLAYLLASVLAD
jgi:hypothetical protein